MSVLYFSSDVAIIPNIGKETLQERNVAQY